MVRPFDRTRWGVLLLALGTAASIACGSPGPGVDATYQVEPLTSPASADSWFPSLTADSGSPLLSWVEQVDEVSTLKFAERTGDGWSSARTVVSEADWFLTAADVPSVVRLADGSLAAHWYPTTEAELEAYDIHLSFSKDEGRTWTPATQPHHDGTKTQHGFASLFQMPGAGLGLAWLDGRTMETEADQGNDNMSLRAAIFDSEGQQVSETLVDERVCECCQTAVAVTSSGPVVAYRNRTDEEQRDIYVSRLVDGSWSTPATVHDDGWRILACPVNGPALSANGQQVVVVWYTVVDDRGHAFAAFSNDAGETFGSPIPLDDESSLGRVDVELIGDGLAVASWVEFSEGMREFRFRRVASSGERGAPQTLGEVDGGRSSGYLEMVRDGDDLLFAWTEGGASTQVRTAVARVVAP